MMIHADKVNTFAYAFSKVRQVSSISKPTFTLSQMIIILVSMIVGCWHWFGAAFSAKKRAYVGNAGLYTLCHALCLFNFTPASYLLFISPGMQHECISA